MSKYVIEIFNADEPEKILKFVKFTSALSALKYTRENVIYPIQCRHKVVKEKPRELTQQQLDKAINKTRKMRREMLVRIAKHQQRWRHSNPNYVPWKYRKRKVEK